MDKIRQRLKNVTSGDIAFAVYITSVMTLIITAYFIEVPPEVKQYLTESVPGVSGRLIPVDSQYYWVIIQISNVTLGAALIFSLLAAIFIARRRNVFEIFAVMAAGMLPRERKYWGVISDVNSSAKVAFASIRVYKLSNGNRELIAQTVADLDGRYRIEIKEKLPEVILKVEAPDYQPYEQTIKSTSLDNATWVLLTDIELVKLQATKSSWQKFLSDIRPRMYIFLVWSIAIFTFISWVVGIVAAVNNPVFVSLLYVVVYTVSIIWNFKVIQSRINPDKGRIINKNANLAIFNAQIDLFNADTKLATGRTDKDGVVNFAMPKGRYTIKITVPGIAIDFPVMEVNLSSQGYLTKNIFLDIAGDIAQPVEQAAGQLQSPFGN